MIRGHLSLNELEAQHADQHRLLFQNCLGIVEKVFTTVPTADNIPVGYAAIYESGSTRRLYFNVNGTVTYVAFGAVSDDSGDMLYADTRFKIASFTRDTSLANGTQVIVSVGFQPKAVIFLGAIDTTAEATWGFDTQTDYGFVGANRNGTGIFGVDDNYSLILLQTDASVYYGGLISSFDSDGFTITWEKVGDKSGVALINFLAFR